MVLALVLSILHGRASKVLAFIEHENPFSIHPVVAGERELAREPSLACDRRMIELLCQLCDSAREICCHDPAN